MLKTTYTETSEGIFPHLPMCANGVKFLAPVMIKYNKHFKTVSEMKELKPPLRDGGGRLIYALPGSRSIPHGAAIYHE